MGISGARDVGGRGTARLGYRGTMPRPAQALLEDLMRVWDALEPSYRLSASYVARVGNIGPVEDEEAGPVIATRFSLTQQTGKAR